MRRALLPGTRRAAPDRALARPETVRSLDQAIAECEEAEAAVKELRRNLAMAESRQAILRQLKSAMARAVMAEAKAVRAGRAGAKACAPPAYEIRFRNAATGADGDSKPDAPSQQNGTWPNMYAPECPAKPVPD